MSVANPAWDKRTRKSQLPGSGARTLVLSGNLTLGATHEEWLRIDCNGAARNVSIDASHNRSGAHFTIDNVSAGAYNATVKNSAGSTIYVQGRGELVTYVYDGDNSTWRAFASAGDVLVSLSAGSLGALALCLGPDLTHGQQTWVYEATVSPVAIETALITLPANSVVDSVQANAEAALTGGGTTVTYGIGITGDVDKFGTVYAAGAQSNSLAKNSKINMIGDPGPNAGAGLHGMNAATVAVKLIGAAAGGTAAGDTALTVGSVKVRIVYRVIASIADAP